METIKNQILARRMLKMMVHNNNDKDGEHVQADNSETWAKKDTIFYAVASVPS